MTESTKQIEQEIMTSIRFGSVRPGGECSAYTENPFKVRYHLRRTAYGTWSFCRAVPGEMAETVVGPLNATKRAVLDDWHKRGGPTPPPKPRIGHSGLARRAREIREEIALWGIVDRAALAHRTDEAGGPAGDAARELRALRNSLIRVFKEGPEDMNSVKHLI